MKATGLTAFMARVDAAEYGLCRRLNRGAAYVLPRRIFQVASRLGDGIVWYVLLAVLPLLYGSAALRPVLVMALTGAVGVVLYSFLKRIFVRERPFITHAAIDRAAAPLDRYSFPVRPYAARGLLYLAGERALPRTGVAPAAAGCPDRSFTGGARTALPVGRARRSRPRCRSGRSGTCPRLAGAPVQPLPERHRQA